MMAKELIYEIKILGNDTAIREQALLRSEISNLSKELKNPALSGDQIQSMSNKLIEAKANMALVTNEVKNQVREAEKLKYTETSYRALNAELAGLKEQYRNLTEAERNAASGNELINKIQILDTNLKAIDADMGQFQRNVGNYEKGIISAFSKSGLTDLAREQISKLEQAQQRANDKVSDLKIAYSKAREEGSDALNKIQKELEQTVLDQQRLNASVDAATEEFKKAEGGFGAFAGNMKSEIKGGMTNAFKQLGAVVIATFAFDRIFSFGKESLAAFREAEKGANLLKNAVVNIGNEGAESFNELIQQATELSAANGGSIFGDDDIIAAQTYFKTFGLGSKQIKDAIPTIIEFAQQNGLTLQESAEKFIKGVNGQGKALKEYGITVTDTGDKNKNYAITLEQMAQKSKGAFDALPESERNLIKFKDTIGELKESIGEKLIVGFNKAIDIAFKFGAKLKDLGVFINENKGLFIALVSTVAGYTLAMNASTIATNITAAAKAAWAVVTKGVTVAQRALNFVLAANPIGLVVTAIGILIGLFIDWYNRSEQVRLVTAGLFNVVSSVFKDLWNAAKTYLGGIGDILIGVFTLDKDRILKGFKETFEGAKDIYKTGFNAIKDTFNGGFQDEFNKGVQEQKIKEDAKKLEEAKRKAQEEAQKASLQSNDLNKTTGADEYGKKIGKEIKEGAKEELKDLREVLKKQTEDQFEIDTGTINKSQFTDEQNAINDLSLRTAKIELIEKELSILRQKGFTEVQLYERIVELEQLRKSVNDDQLKIQEKIQGKIQEQKNTLQDYTLNGSTSNADNPESVLAGFDELKNDRIVKEIDPTESPKERARKEREINIEILNDKISALEQIGNAERELWELKKQLGEEEKAQQDDILQKRQGVVSRISEIASKSFSMLGDISQTISNAQLRRAENEIKSEEQLAKRKEEIQKQAARRGKALSIIEASINTAVSVTKALTSAAWPLNLVFAALAGAMGAAQIAVIASQKLARGGKIGMGLSNVQGGTIPSGSGIITESLMRQKVAN